MRNSLPSVRGFPSVAAKLVHLLILLMSLSGGSLGFYSNCRRALFSEVSITEMWE